MGDHRLPKVVAPRRDLSSLCAGVIVGTLMFGLGWYLGGDLAQCIPM